MAEYIKEPAKETAVLMDADVAVIGGGPAGIAASVSSARAGAKTVVVERYGCFGGLLSLGAMEPPSWYRLEQTTMPGGIVEDLDRKMIAMGAVSKTFFKPSAAVAYDTEMFKYAADEFIKENGVIPVLHCLGVFPVMEENTVTGIITESKSGRLAIRAKRVIDCTGDADIAFRAGAECAVLDGPNGSIPEGKFHQGTLVYGLSDVDTAALEADADADPANRHPIMHRGMHHWWEAARAAGEKMPEGTNKRFIYNRVPEQVHCFTWVDGTDVLSLTRAEMQSRSDIVNIIPVLRKYQKGMENAKLRNFALTIGVRETRRIKGEYAITFKEIFDEARFPDSIGIYPICLDGPEGVMPGFTPAYFQVPYGITVPQKIENLLAAGRCVSAERRSHSITRHVNFAMVTGQAAGAAAALSIKQDVLVRGVDIKALQKELERQGVRIG